MEWTEKLLICLLLQSLLIVDIHGNANRRRRRRQTSGSLYGTNANLGASAPAGYNYPASTNIKGIRMNNPDARDLYGNPVIHSSLPSSGNTLNSMNYYNQPRPQQQQIYGNNDQSAANPVYSGTNFYSGSNTNQGLRDPNGNLLPGSMGTSFYSSSNTQMASPPDPNQVLYNRDLYGTQSNTNNNNNQYGYNSNQLPNSNTYGGSMGSNSNLPSNNNNNFYSGQMGSNTNLVPNSNTYSGVMGTNTYGGQIGGNANLIPNSNTYSGVMGTNNNPNQWSNTNNYNRQNQNSANTWYPSRDTNYNNNYGNSNPYGNYYNTSYRLGTSSLLLIMTIFTIGLLY